MVDYCAEVVKYRVNFINSRGEAKHKICYTIEQAYASCKQIQELEGKVVSVQQINNIIFFD